MNEQFQFESQIEVFDKFRGPYSNLRPLIKIIWPIFIIMTLPSTYFLFNKFNIWVGIVDLVLTIGLFIGWLHLVKDHTQNMDISVRIDFYDDHMNIFYNDIAFIESDKYYKELRCHTIKYADVSTVSYNSSKRLLEISGLFTIQKYKTLWENATYGDMDQEICNQATIDFTLANVVENDVLNIIRKQTGKTITY